MPRRCGSACPLMRDGDGPTETQLAGAGTWQGCSSPCALGPERGVVAISVYLKDGEGLKGGNLSTIWRLTEHLHELNSKGHNWIVAGDLNMPFEELNLCSGWAE